MGVSPRGNDSGSWVEEGDYLGLTLGGAGSEGCHGDSSFGHYRALDEIELASGPGEDARAYRVGADLSGEVYLRGGVDGHHVGVAGDRPGIVDVLDVLHQHVRIVVDE